MLAYLGIAALLATGFILGILIWHVFDRHTKTDWLMVTFAVLILIPLLIIGSVLAA